MSEGLGLGLTLSKRIIELLGGHLSATNAQPHGATLTMTMKVFAAKKGTDHE